MAYGWWSTHGGHLRRDPPDHQNTEGEGELIAHLHILLFFFLFWVPISISSHLLFSSSNTLSSLKRSIKRRTKRFAFWENKKVNLCCIMGTSLCSILFFVIISLDIFFFFYCMKISITQFYSLTAPPSSFSFNCMCILYSGIKGLLGFASSFFVFLIFKME